MSKLSRIINRLLMPPKCGACGVLLDYSPSDEHIDALCPDCRGEWERSKLHRCQKCLQPMIDCRCAPSVLGKTELIKLVSYKSTDHGVVGRILFRMKDKAPRELCGFLATQLSFPLEKAIREYGIDRENIVITFLPRTKSKKREIGTDQSELLAKCLSERLGVAYGRLFKSEGDALEQKKLGVKERRLNMLSSFSLIDVGLDGKTVILLDDIVTTGASMNACLKLLRGTGAERIICASVAFTAKKGRRFKKVKNTH